MKYSFFNKMLLRRPVQSPAAYGKGLAFFLEDPLFMAAVRLATPVFYVKLEKHLSEGSELSSKEALTLQKYINRYCYRPTPFGLFSAVQLIEWRGTCSENKDRSALMANVHTAMPLLVQLEEQLTGSAKAKYECNPTLYRVMNEYRFVRTGLNEAGQQREYQLQSIAFTRILGGLSNYCRTPRQRTDITAHIAAAAACELSEAADYTAFLIDARFLVDHGRLNITGKGQSATILSLPEGGRNMEQLQSLSKGLNISSTTIGPAAIDRLEGLLSGLLPALSDTTEKLSIIMKEDNRGDAVGASVRKKLREGLHALSSLTQDHRPVELKRFVSAFNKHFEGQTLPLLLALDPEAGIGYQLPEIERNNPLLETLNIPYLSSPGTNQNWSTTHSLIMEAWLRMDPGQNVVRINDELLERAGKNAPDNPILGMSVLFRLTEDQVLIENAGGINAPALMGRFTLADEAIAAAAQEMARQLEEQNPEVIFAELLHLADPHTDNINRRDHIYKYELPITAASRLPREQQLQLSDLYLSIVGSQIILFSERHQKAVIPRLTSAYNHSLNRLPLFRFLADLSYQYARSSLALDLRQLFPGLSSYPRVEYKNTILSLAIWVLNSEQIDGLSSGAERGIAAFREWRDRIGLCRYYSLADGDQELVFDGESEKDVLFFQSCIRNRKEAILKEFPEQDVVKQYNAYLLPEEALELPKTGLFSNDKGKERRKFLPGSSWLYLKIYAPRTGVNRLLLRLRPLLYKAYGGHKVRKWFFIRYEDHAPHIRLRLQVEPDAINDILLAFKNKLENGIRQHVIREFQIDVYSRELERYRAGGIENTEAFFFASSELTLNYLRHSKKVGSPALHTYALYSTYILVSHFLTGQDDQIRFTQLGFQRFLPEFANVPIKVGLDKKYRELAPGILMAFRKEDPGLLCGSAKSGRSFASSLQTIRAYMGPRPDEEYLYSIVHMHLNRIFTDESRKQEMICYYFIHKYLLSVKGRSLSDAKQNAPS
ncbi:lantibiotic dehydratase [Mucilaginibacter pedocola]|uniref:Thiopeptide-type bacteriocin biosynthesis domain-containing protein n=1 Tax=Mucilaginibacter pedocola TaxID=1792845 RepID=A0A1S9P6M9_9SPHI|nr:lantibiotic dehydratase [Mucilaginibacter pedocola]OOQ56613.1 hypothetical protein BC343_19480 [Mucilaginibacter pedocola]